MSNITSKCPTQHRDFPEVRPKLLLPTWEVCIVNVKNTWLERENVSFCKRIDDGNLYCDFQF